MDITAKGHIIFTLPSEGQTDAENFTSVQVFGADEKIIANYPSGAFAWSLYSFSKAEHNNPALAHCIVVTLPCGKLSIAVRNWEIEYDGICTVDVFSGEFEYDGFAAFLNLSDVRQLDNCYFTVSGVAFSGDYSSKSQQWLKPFEYMQLVNRSHALLGRYAFLVEDQHSFQKLKELSFWVDWVEFLRTKEALDLSSSLHIAREKYFELQKIAGYVVGTAHKFIASQSPLSSHYGQIEALLDSLPSPEELCFDGEEIAY